MKVNVKILASTFILAATLLSAESCEVRAYIKDIQKSKRVLESLGAEYKGDYLCTENIYAVNPAIIDLDTEFIRLRDYAYSNTGWKQKKVCINHKKRETRKSTRITVYSYEADTLEEAQDIVKNYILLCSYSRQGWEYHFNGMKIYVEDIQGINPSIEIIGQDRAAIDDLLAQLRVESVVSHSLPYLVYASKNSDQLFTQKIDTQEA